MVVQMWEHGKTPPAKKLGWLIKTPPKDAVKMVIGPALAAKMLEYNNETLRPKNMIRQRPLSKHTARQYASQMTAGEWRLIRAPITFSKSGLLQDGQHRLTACVMSGIDLEAWVAFGDPDENFAFIDGNKKRSGSDIFSSYGVSDPHIMSAASRWVWSYEKGGFDPARNTGLAGYITPNNLYKYYLGLDRLAESAKFGARMCRYKIGPPGPMTAAHYVCARRNRTRANDLFATVTTGVGMTKLHAKLRDTLRDYKEGPGRTQQVFLTAAMLNGFNALQHNTRPRTFKWREDDRQEKFPTV